MLFCWIPWCCLAGDPITSMVLQYYARDLGAVFLETLIRCCYAVDPNKLLLCLNP